METDKIISIATIALLVICMAGIYTPNSSILGGSVHNQQESFDAGIAVNQSEIINSSGEYVGALAATTGTLSSTLTVTGETNVSNFVQGGASYTSADGSTHVVLTAAQMCDNGYIGITPTAAGINVTTPSAAALMADCIPTIGDRASFYYENLASGATSTTMVAGSSIDLIEPTGGDVVIDQNEDAFIEFLNVDGTNVKVIIHSLQVAD